MIVSKFVIDKNIINNEISILNNILNQQRQLKKTLLVYLEKISEGISNAINPEDANSLLSCLDGIKKSFENIKENINKTTDLKLYLENITRFDALDTSYLEKYNKDFLELFNKVSEDNIFYYSFMESLLKYMKVIFPEKSIINNDLDKQVKQIVEDYLSSKNIGQMPTMPLATENINTPSEDLPNDENLKKDNIQTPEKTQEFIENTLLILEKKKIAILPYSVIELEDCFSNNPEKYSSIQDIINKEYTVSLNKYKNASFSRFKEAFNLAKNKSHLSFIKSLDLANELFFNTNLNPVVITACKNIDELDIYLSCLEYNILDKFKCFNILYN